MMSRTRRAAGTKRRRGTAMVEAAITLPIVMLVLFGSMEFGLVFSRYQILLGTTATAARVASVFRAPCNPADVTLEVEKAIGAGSLLGMDLTNTALTQINITGLCLPGRFVEVDVIYFMPAQFLGGMMMPLFGGAAIANWPLHARVRMRNDS